MKSLRPWVTPLTVATGLITIVSGVLLFFHLSPGLTRSAHEMIGMAMVVAVGLHLALNYRAFLIYFRKPIGLGVMVLGAVATVASFAIPTSSTRSGPEGMRAVFMSLNGARIETLADLAGKDTEAVLARLGAAGIEATGSQTLAALSNGDRAKQDKIIGLVFAD